MGNNLNLAIGRGGDGNAVAQVVGAAVNLDVVLEELLKGGDVEDLVAGRLRSVDDELYREDFVLASPVKGGESGLSIFCLFEW